MREHITPTDLIQRLLPRPRALAAWRAHAAWRAVVLSLACLPLLLVVGAAPAAAFSFAPAAHFAVGRGPAAVAVGDFNGDGRPDVATANAKGDAVSVLLGNGRGGFSSKTRFATGRGPESVAVGDFNGDGKQDLVTANGRAGTVSVLLGLGRGGFAAKADFGAGPMPVAVAVGDFNGDHKQDLVATDLDWEAGGASVLLGDGSGGFAPRIEVATGPADYDIAVGEFNGDGNADLATVVTDDFDGLAGVLLGDGTGHFSAMSSSSQYLEPVAIAVGDFNGDGRQDLVTAQRLEGRGEIGLLLGDGAGVFHGAAEGGMQISREVFCVAFGDLNGDGKQDVLSAKGSAVIVLRGDGRFDLAKEQDFPIGRSPSDVAVADLDRDGLQDVVTADYAAGSVTVLLNGPHEAPVLRGISPARGMAGAVVTLTGLRFGVRQGAGAVRFGSVKATGYVSWNSTKIKVRVPAGTAAGRVRVTVKTVAGRSRARCFRRLQASPGAAATAVAGRLGRA